MPSTLGSRFGCGAGLSAFGGRFSATNPGDRRGRNRGRGVGLRRADPRACVANSVLFTGFAFAVTVAAETSAKVAVIDATRDPTPRG